METVHILWIIYTAISYTMVGKLITHGQEYADEKEWSEDKKLLVDVFSIAIGYLLPIFYVLLTIWSLMKKDSET